MYLVSGHCERVDVTLFRGDAVQEGPQRVTEQLRTHVANDPVLRRQRAVWFPTSGIDDTYNPEVSQARGTTLVDQNISLDKIRCVRFELKTPPILTGFTLPCTIPSECKCPRPQAACASYPRKFQTVSSVRIMKRRSPAATDSPAGFYGRTRRGSHLASKV